MDKKDLQIQIITDFSLSLWTKLKDGLCAGDQLKARNGLQWVRTISVDWIPPRSGVRPRPPPGADPIRIC